MFLEADDIEIGSPERPSIGLFDRERNEDYSKNHRVVSLREKVLFQGEYLNHLKEDHSHTDQRLKELKTEFFKHRTLLEKLKISRNIMADKLAIEEEHAAQRPSVRNLISDFAHAETRLNYLRQRKVMLEAVTFELMKNVADAATRQLKCFPMDTQDLDAKSTCSMESDRTVTASDNDMPKWSASHTSVSGWHDSADVISVIEFPPKDVKRYPLLRTAENRRLLSFFRRVRKFFRRR